MTALIHHSPRQLRQGLRSAVRGEITVHFRKVEAELRLAGFLTGPATLTAAGWRYLHGDAQLAAA